MIDKKLTTQDLPSIYPSALRNGTPSQNTGSSSINKTLAGEKKNKPNDKAPVIKKYDSAQAVPSVKLPDNDTDALGAMQQQFGLINLDGKVWVFDRIALKARTNQGVAAKLKLSPRQDGALLIKRALKAQYPGVSAKEIVDAFWVSAQTVCYCGVDFNPRGASEDYLNLWVGPTIVPKQGEWGLISILLLPKLSDF